MSNRCKTLPPPFNLNCWPKSNRVFPFFFSPSDTIAFGPFKATAPSRRQLSIKKFNTNSIRKHRVTLHKSKLIFYICKVNQKYLVFAFWNIFLKHFEPSSSSSSSSAIWLSHRWFSELTNKAKTTNPPADEWIRTSSPNFSSYFDSLLSCSFEELCLYNPTSGAMTFQSIPPLSLFRAPPNLAPAAVSAHKKGEETQFRLNPFFLCFFRQKCSPFCKHLKPPAIGRSFIWESKFSSTCCAKSSLLH